LLPLWEFRKKTCEPTDGGKATENGVFSIRCNSRIENEEFHPLSLLLSFFIESAGFTISDKRRRVCLQTDSEDSCQVSRLRAIRQWDVDNIRKEAQELPQILRKGKTLLDKIPRFNQIFSQSKIEPLLFKNNLLP
jgi:hypothetical protein